MDFNFFNYLINSLNKIFQACLYRIRNSATEAKKAMINQVIMGFFGLNSIVIIL
jgi:hypothetical protein